jgi:hypothetical protein
MISTASTKSLFNSPTNAILSREKRNSSVILARSRGSFANLCVIDFSGTMFYLEVSRSPLCKYKAIRQYFALNLCTSYWDGSVTAELQQLHDHELFTNNSV